MITSYYQYVCTVYNVHNNNIVPCFWYCWPCGKVLHMGRYDGVYIVQRTVYSVQRTLYSVQCTLYRVQCTVYSVYSTRCRALSSFLLLIIHDTTRALLCCKIN